MYSKNLILILFIFSIIFLFGCLKIEATEQDIYRNSHKIPYECESLQNSYKFGNCISDLSVSQKNPDLCYFLRSYKYDGKTDDECFSTHAFQTKNTSLCVIIQNLNENATAFSCGHYENRCVVDRSAESDSCISHISKVTKNFKSCNLIKNDNVHDGCIVEINSSVCDILKVPYNKLNCRIRNNENFSKLDCQEFYNDTWLYNKCIGKVYEILLREVKDSDCQEFYNETRLYQHCRYEIRVIASRNTNVSFCQGVYKETKIDTDECRYKNWIFALKNANVSDCQVYNETRFYQRCLYDIRIIALINAKVSATDYEEVPSNVDK
ncbi:MAG: hypothetical protein Q7S22_00135 [Candidatus Micrarchaeota archaeon]|nr:hypothetical protein [Candidatus Micrarchaeota archaeon]